MAIKFSFGWGIDEERKYFCEMDINSFKMHFSRHLEHQDQINAIIFSLGCAIAPRNIESTEFQMSASKVRIYITGREEKNAVCEKP